MPSPSVDTSNGTTLSFSGWSAEIVSMEFDEISREEIDATHLASAEEDNFGGREYIPAALVEPGGVEMEIHLNPDTDPPIDGAEAECTITFPAGASWVASAFMSRYGGPSLPGPDDKMTATVRLKFTGGITITPG